MLPEAEEGVAGRPEGLGRPAKVLAAPFPRPHLHHLLQRLNVEAWHPSRHAAHRKGEAAGRQARSRVALAARHSGGLRRNSAEFKQREEALQARGRHPSIASHSHRAWADPKLDNAPPMRAFGTAVSSHTSSRCGPGVGCKGDAAVAAADVTAEGALPAGALITGTSQKIQALGLQSYRAAGKIRSDCIEGKLWQRRVIDLGRET